MFLNYLVEILEIKNMNGTSKKAFRLPHCLSKPRPSCFLALYRLTTNF